MSDHLEQARHLLECQRDIQQDPKDDPPIPHPNRYNCEKPVVLLSRLSVHQCISMCRGWQGWQNCYWHRFDVVAVAGSHASGAVLPAAVASWYVPLPPQASVLPPGAHVISVHRLLLHRWAGALEANVPVMLNTVLTTEQ